MRTFLFLFLLALTLPSCAQHGPLPLTTARHPVMVGKDSVWIEESNYGTGLPYLLLKLHDNEQTAEEAGRQWLSKAGGRLITLENRGQRLLPFRMGTRDCQVDPNRIFSEAGIRSSLDLLSRCGPEAIPEAARLASALTSLLGDTGLLVAVHNNTDSAYSVKDYLPGAALAADAAEAFHNPMLDPDDFILTTDAALYRRYRSLGYNCVLQSPEVKDDGSLSVYFGRQSRRYINIECEHGHLEQQLQLLGILED